VDGTETDKLLPIWETFFQLSDLVGRDPVLSHNKVHDHRVVSQAEENSQSADSGITPPPIRSIAQPPQERCKNQHAGGVNQAEVSFLDQYRDLGKT
jgi:hypothetical protein